MGCDPGRSWEGGRGRRPADEPLGMGGVGRLEHIGALELLYPKAADAKSTVA